MLTCLCLLLRANILEEDRSFQFKAVKVPGDEISKLEFLDQMRSLKELVIRQNINFEYLLNDRKKEKQEVISVAMGKLKKREKTKQELGISFVVIFTSIRFGLLFVCLFFLFFFCFFVCLFVLFVCFVCLFYLFVCCC
jgi:hypothetical protein